MIGKLKYNNYICTMEQQLHTEIDLKITPIGAEPYVQTHLFENIVLDADGADEYISWGNERNDILKDAVYYSPFAALENYEVIRCDVFTYGDLEQRELMKQIADTKPKKKLGKVTSIEMTEGVNIQSIDDVVELTEEEKVSIASANGIKWALANSDRLAQKKKVSLEEQWKDLGSNGWLNPKGEFFEVAWHVNFASEYIERDYNLDEAYERFRDDDNHWNENSCDFLESLGWIRIQGDRSGNRHYVENAQFRSINYIQMRKLTLICMKYGADFKKVIGNSEWDWNLSKHKYR